MPELDIHLRLASLEADVAAIRNFITGEHGPNALPPARIDHPSIVTPIDVGATVTEDVPTPPPVAQPTVQGRGGGGW